MKRMLLFLMLIAGQATPVHAYEVTAREFLEGWEKLERLPQEAKDKLPGLRMYAVGLLFGISWANLEAMDRGKPLYCPPNNLKLNADYAVRILKQQIEKVATDADSPMGLVLLEALLKSFPCPN